MLSQSHFRFYDDAWPGSAAPLAAEDVALSAVQANAEVLVRLQTACDSAAQVARRLEVRPAGGAWTQVSSAEGDTPIVMETSSWFTEPATIATARLSAPGGDFISGEARDIASETEVASFAPAEYTEDLFKIRVAGGIASLGATYELRLTNAGAAYGGYDNLPQITVSDVVSPSVMDVKANARFADRRPLAKLEYWRDAAWHDLSDRLLFPIKVHRRLGAAATAEMMLDNCDGELARGNLASPLNYDASSAYDPLLDENRKVRLSQGWEVHPNLLFARTYVCTPAPVASYADPQGVKLTDGHFGAFAGWAPAAGAPVIITCSLAAPAKVKGAAVSAWSKTTQGIYRPGSAAAVLHAAGGDVGPLPLAADHLADDPAGRAKRLLGLDWETNSVYAVSFYLYAQGETALVVDEVALYDATTTCDWQRATFTGLLGDEISYSSLPRGAVRLGQVRDTTKRLADRFVESFRHYRNETVEGVLEDLLVNSFYGLELEAGEFQLAVSSFAMPKWSEQNATLLDGCAQLAKMVGHTFGADEEGRYIFANLEWQAQSAEESYRPEEDLLGWQPVVSGLDLRNKVMIRSRDARQRDFAVTVADDDSIARYGERLFTLYEPTMRTAPLARQLARSILRDYSWVHPAGAGEAAGDVFLRPGAIVSVVESGAAYSAKEDLYRVEALATAQTGQRCGDYTMVMELRGYRPAVPDAPGSLTATPLEAGAQLAWADLEDASVAFYGAFQAGSFGGAFVPVGSVANSPITLDGLTNGEEYWFKVAAFTADGRRGDFAGPINCVPTSGGTPALAEDLYRPTSLSVAMGGFFNRPELRWHSGLLGAEEGAYFNIYRAQDSPEGSWINIGSKQKRDTEPIFWRDFSTMPAGATLYYRVTYWQKTGFESLPSSWAEIEV